MNNLRLQNMKNKRLALAVKRAEALRDAPFEGAVYTGKMPVEFKIAKARALAIKGMQMQGGAK
jgi:hypothetical protein|tara:strand:- start:47 stop:235 length:189 start_codon:yes stop_codon:yes gene_type:complete